MEKIKAYQLQDAGMDTIDANLHLGHEIDARDWSDAIAIVRALGLKELTLLTNNPNKVQALRNAGVEVTQANSNGDWIAGATGAIPLSSSTEIIGIECCSAKATRDAPRAIDPSSLTISDNVVAVWLIPETLERTNLSGKKAGDLINVEVDVLAKYVERLLAKGEK